MSDQVAVRGVGATSGWGQLRHNLQLLTLLVRRELKVKYRGSFLGYLWSMLNPLLFMLIITLVLSRLNGGVENYSLFVLCGILFWNMTLQALVGGTNAIRGNAGLLQKVRLPMWVFALVPVGAGLTNLALALIPYFIFFMFKGASVPLGIIALPLVLALYAVFLAGLSLFLATCNVFFRDVAHVIEPVLQLFFYATPILYDRHNPSLFSDRVRTLLGLSPFTRFLELFRTSIYHSEQVSPLVVSCLVVAAALSLGCGSLFYRRQRNAIAFRL